MLTAATPPRGVAPQPEIQRRHAEPRLLLIVLAFSVLVLSHSAATPLFEAPDEVWHYAYVRWISEGNGLPPLDSDISGAYQEAAQPPLYYLSAALVSSCFDDNNLADLAWGNPGFGHQAPGTVPDNKNMLIHTRAEGFPWRGAALAVHATRLASWVYGLIAVVAAYGFGLAAFQSRRWALVVGALVAFQPQFVFISSVVSNDSAAAAVSTLALWLATRTLVRGTTRRRSVAAGAVSGLAMLTKTSALPVVPMLAVCVGVGTLRRGEQGSWQRALRRALAMVAVQISIAAATGGWWYLRNLTEYGQLLAVATHTGTPWGRSDLASLSQLIAEAPLLLRSFWAAYGWGHVTWPNWIYAALWILTLPLFIVGVLSAAQGCLGAASVVPRSAGREEQGTRRSAANGVPSTDVAKRLLRYPESAVLGLREASPRVAAGVLAAVWCFGIGSALLHWMRQVQAPHGRLLFPALGAWSLLLTLGIRQMESRHPHVGRRLRATLLLMCASLATLAPGARILATFAPPRLRTPAEVIDDCTHATDIVYGDVARLFCTTVTPARTAPGDMVTVEMCWESLARTSQDLTVFAHLIGPEATRPAERHTYPGLGRYPTSLWAPNTAFCDTVTMPVALWADAPIRYILEVGLFDAETGERLPAYVGGQPIGPPIAGTVDVVSTGGLADDQASGEAVATLRQEPFAASLVSATAPRSARPGDEIEITLVWQAEQSSGGINHAVFVHLWDPGTVVPWAQNDSQPRNGWFPTSAWDADDVIPDRHSLRLPADLPLGPHTLWAGLYDPASGLRVPAYDAGRSLQNDMIPVATIEACPPK